MKKFFVFTTILLIPVLILATSEADITFPIPELGNCATKEECFTYCEDPSHRSECEEFAEKHNLKPPDVTFPVAELGNCNSKEECEEYCEQPENMRVCIEYAKAHDLMDEEELEEAERILPFIESGQTPGGCTKKEECMSYCDDPSHFEECLNFIEKADIVTSEEARMIRKVGSFTGPGGCKHDECEGYCEKPENFETCIQFAEQHGMISAAEAQMARRFGLTGGPGGCRGKEECEAYCNDPSHMDACINFAVENGFMTSEEAEMARKSGGFNEAGPGGCTGREECEAYCDDPNHREECIEFAHEKGFISDEEYQKAQQFRGEEFTGPGGCRGQECESFCNDPANAENCYQWAVEHGYAESHPEYQGGPGPSGEGQMTGPGGCRTPEECQAYCEQHPEECGLQPQQFPEGTYPEGQFPEEFPPPIEHEEGISTYPEGTYPTSPEIIQQPTEIHQEETSSETPLGAFITIIRIFQKALKA